MTEEEEGRLRAALRTWGRQLAKRVAGEGPMGRTAQQMGP